MKRTALAMLAAAVIAPAAVTRTDTPGPVSSFRLVGTFNVPNGNSAEIISATPDGRHVVYSDAIGQRFGLVDISNPAAPVEIADIDVDGSPTSIAVLPDGEHAVACVQPGRLLLIDLDTFTVIGERAIGAGPDSVAVTTIDGTIVALIAIENEGVLGKGYVEVVRINLNNFAASPTATVQFDNAAALAAAGLRLTDDPQPEFISIYGTRAAVTLQENNGIAIIDIANPAAPSLVQVFNTGYVADRAADLIDNSQVEFVQRYPSDADDQTDGTGARIPDAIAWSADGTTLFTADEGEESFEGGRGWSAHHATGGLYYDDGGELEQTAVRFGHYPDGRSDAKGIEMEGLATARYGEREFLFVTSERGSFVAVYRLDPQNRAHFVQLLGTGQGPESALPIPQRSLFLTANEGDDGDGSISIFAGIPGEGPVDQNRAQLAGDPATPWGALSGLAGSASPQLLFAVPDNALPSIIYRIRTGGDVAAVEHHAPVTLNGEQAFFDLEGIAIDTSIERPAHGAGFWLAAEGDFNIGTRNELIQVDDRGRVLREIFLPADVDAPGGRITTNGFEGLTVSSDGRYLVVAVQRPFTGDSSVAGIAHTRIARYDLSLERWDTFFYPLTTSPGTIGLSEITVVGQTAGGSDIFAVIERDNRLAGNANLKRIYTFSFEGLMPVSIETAANASTVPGARVQKSLWRDILPEFRPYEKVEGLGLTVRGDLWVVLDNDGGEFESRFVRFPAAF